jgi:HK97 family phage major capsid protein
MGLSEDVTSGSGAANAVIATIWSHDVVDLIRAKTFLFKAGATTVPLPSEIYNLPLFQADVAPQYLAETASVSLDVTPNLGTIQFNCQGAYVDNTGASLNALEDAYNTGGLYDLISNSISKKWARLMESLALYGQAGAPGMPGIVNETGLLVQSMGTHGAAPTSCKDISKAVAQVRSQNVEPTAIVSHPGTMAEYAQLVDTLGQPMRKTPDIADIPWLDSGLLSYQSETQGTANNASPSTSVTGPTSTSASGCPRQFRSSRPAPGTSTSR